MVTYTRNSANIAFPGIHPERKRRGHTSAHNGHSETTGVCQGCLGAVFPAVSSRFRVIMFLCSSRLPSFHSVDPPLQHLKIKLPPVPRLCTQHSYPPTWLEAKPGAGLGDAPRSWVGWLLLTGFDLAAPSSYQSAQYSDVGSILPDRALRGATFDKLDLKKAGPLVKTGRANLPSTCLD